MKLTNRKMVQDANFLGTLNNKQFNIKVSYAIAKNIAKIESELKIYNKEREKLVEKYCIKNEDGKVFIDENHNFKLKDDCINDWNREINDLLDIEVEVDIHKFDLDDLMNCNVDMSPAELNLIDYMIRA